jgi:hypothetical protein
VGASAPAPGACAGSHLSRGACPPVAFLLLFLSRRHVL